jgi:hypothetical protein
VLKVRRDQKPGDYKDPGWFKHPKGTVAYEWQGDAPAAQSRKAATPASPSNPPLNVRKPSGHEGHSH